MIMCRSAFVKERKKNLAFMNKIAFNMHNVLRLSRIIIQIDRLGNGITIQI